MTSGINPPYRPSADVTGRPTLYGAVTGGLAGAKNEIDIFRTEIDLVMGQIGCPSLAELGPNLPMRDDWTRYH